MCSRKAEKKDLQKIVELNRECFFAPTSPATFRVALEMNSSTFLVFEENSFVAGYIMAVTSVENDTGWVRQVGVQQVSRRKGVARKLICSVLDEFSMHGIKKAVATCAPTNKASLELFRTLGFETEAMEEDMYGPGEDRIILSKML